MLGARGEARMRRVYNVGRGRVHVDLYATDGAVYLPGYLVAIRRCLRLGGSVHLLCDPFS